MQPCPFALQGEPKPAVAILAAEVDVAADDVASVPGHEAPEAVLNGAVHVQLVGAAALGPLAHRRDGRVGRQQAHHVRGKVADGGAARLRLARATRGLARRVLPCGPRERAEAALVDEARAGAAGAPADGPRRIFAQRAGEFGQRPHPRPGLRRRGVDQWTREEARLRGGEETRRTFQVGVGCGGAHAACAQRGGGGGATYNAPPHPTQPHHTPTNPPT